jgi:hypothetical protein
MLGLPVVLEPGLTELRPDAQPIPGQAVVHLAFSEGAPPACNQDNPYAATIRLGLPDDGGSLDLALSPNASPPGIEVCYPVGLTRFEDPALVWATPEASPLFASIAGPAQARRGENLRLLVTLRNISESDVSFGEPCPNYTIHIGGEKLGVLAEHMLNCAPAGVLDPGESVTFEVMVTLPSTLPDIPSDASLSLNWSLDRPPASADLQIEILNGWPPLSFCGTKNPVGSGGGGDCGVVPRSWFDSAGLRSPRTARDVVLAQNVCIKSTRSGPLCRHTLGPEPRLVSRSS